MVLVVLLLAPCYTSSWFWFAKFEIGDEIFVEKIELSGSGDGYNSEAYDYRFFKVTDYDITSPARLEFKIVDDAGVGLSPMLVLQKLSSLDMQQLSIKSIILKLELFKKEQNSSKMSNYM